MKGFYLSICVLYEIRAARHLMIYGLLRHLLFAVKIIILVLSTGGSVTFFLEESPILGRF
jgi:hypothetical protein